MSFLHFSIVWCGLILVTIVLVRKIHRHMIAQGHKSTFPFAPSELFKFISFCNQTQKETDDKKLKALILLLNTCYAFGVILFLLQAFYS